MTKTNTTVCTIKMLPQTDWIGAAQKAIEINPDNSPVTDQLSLAEPDVTIPPVHLAVLTRKYWGSGGVRLTVGFVDGATADLRNRILSHMNAWGASANVTFVKTVRDPQVRISRTPGGGHWSYLGTDVLRVSTDEPTMNLDGFTMGTPDSEFFRVVRHETGHTLGFPHEHKRKEIVTRIDRGKAIAYFKETQGWSEAKTINNVLTPHDNSSLIATARPDPRSVMCYWLPSSIMKDGVAVPGGNDINPQDSQFAASVYPKVEGPIDATLIHPRNGKAYFFRGDKYQRFNFDNPEKVEKVGTIGKNGWPGVWSEIDAALVHPRNGKAYFFRGNKYQRFNFDNPERVEKVGIIGENGWPGVWSEIDAALVHPHNGKAYFFRGNKYQRFNFDNPERVEKVGIIGENGWPGVWSEIDAVVVHPRNGKAYFFRGEKYQRFNFAAPEEVEKVGTIGVNGWPGV